MKATLKSLRDVRANPALSVFVKTHRHHPDNQQDPIALKNELTLAQNRLEAEFDKRTAATIMEKIDAQLQDWDHNYNLDTLAIFATTEQAVALRLPIDAVPRVIINNRFAVRDLVRDLANSVHYYALVISREHARLIEAVNGRVVKEFDHHDALQQDLTHDKFPVRNTHLYTTSGAESNEDNYLKEFLNRVDKSFQEIWGKTEDKLPLVVIGDARNIAFYKEVSDRASQIVATVDNVTQLEDGSASHIIDSIQDAIDGYRVELHEQAKAEIETARGNNRLRTDLQSIYQTAYQGAGAKLFVRQGYIQPALINEENQSIELSDDPTAEGVTDDVVGEIINLVVTHGGQVAFIPAEIMGDELAIALETRF